jgi:hypothetical protein
MTATGALWKTAARALLLAALPLTVATCGTQRTVPDANDLYYCSVRLSKDGYKLEVDALKAKMEIRNLEVWRSVYATDKQGNQTRVTTASDQSLAKAVLHAEPGKPLEHEGVLHTVRSVRGSRGFLLATADLSFPTDKTIQTPDTPLERNRNRWKWQMVCWNR